MAFGNGDFQYKARSCVFQYVRHHFDKTDEDAFNSFAMDDVYVVWFVKTLQNWKCLISTTFPDLMYYEVTYDGDRKQVHLNAYKKFANGKHRELPDDEGQRIVNLPVIGQAKFQVMMYIKNQVSGWKLLTNRLKDDDVHVLWLAETMQNWKVVAKSWLAGDMLFEVTYNGNQRETYIDAYKLWEDIQISEGEDEPQHSVGDLRRMLEQLPPGALPKT